MISIFVTMAIVFFFSYVPLAVFATIRALLSFYVGAEELLLIELVGHLLYIMSSLINPLLTLTLKDDYRNYLVKLFRCRRRDDETKSELMSGTMEVSTNGL